MLPSWEPGRREGIEEEERERMWEGPKEKEERGEAEGARAIVTLQRHSPGHPYPATLSHFLISNNAIK